MRNGEIPFDSNGEIFRIDDVTVEGSEEIGTKYKDGSTSIRGTYYQSNTKLSSNRGRELSLKSRVGLIM